ncbi:MAG: hypothetical protein J5849_01380 [Clostridia bacterium]|nr:hypothetical protein [Clostridia bacterium]MBR5742890.1 hypothetical protein [Clostridia bacterium]
MYFPAKRITIYAGHYGSGKTNLAVNHALALRRAGKRVKILDLDIVNPYFRTKDSEELFRREGIELIASEFAGTNVDIPAIPAAAQSAFDDRSSTVVIDVGGDDAGALALGRYQKAINEEDYDMLLVLNRFRPLARTPEDAAAIAREIEAASRVRFTGVAANSNLGSETDAEAVLSSEEYTVSTAKALGLPVVFRAVRRDLVPALGQKLERVQPVEITGKVWF